MRNIGGLILLASIALTGCSAPTEASHPVGAESPAAKIAPLVAAPEPSTSSTSGDLDVTARDTFLAGVKKNWRETEVPSDDVLVQHGAEACSLFDQGLTMGEIGERGGSTIADWDNAAAIAIYASRVFCTRHNTDSH